MVDVATPPVKWLLRLVAVGYVFFLVAWPVSLIVEETFADGLTTLTDTLSDPARPGRAAPDGRGGLLGGGDQPASSA